MKDLNLTLFDRRNVDGVEGPYLKSFRTENGFLYVTDSEGIESPLGQLLPKPARNLAEVNIDENGELICTFDNGDVTNLGYANNVVETRYKEYVGAGIYSSNLDDFKPIVVKDGNVSPTSTNVTLSKTLVSKDHIVDGVDLDSVRNYHIYTTIDDRDDPSWWVDNVLLWDGTTDGVVELPAGNVEVTVTFPHVDIVDTELQIVDSETGEVLKNTVQTSSNPDYVGTTINVKLTIFNPTPRSVKVKYIYHDTFTGYPFGHYSGYPTDGSKIGFGTLTVVKTTDAPLEILDFTEIENIPEMDPLLVEYFSNKDSIEIESFENWMTETISSTVRDVYGDDKYVYVQTSVSSILVIEVATKKVKRFSVRTYRASLNCRFAGGSLYVSANSNDEPYILKITGFEMEEMTHKRFNATYTPNLSTTHFLEFAEEDGVSAYRLYDAVTLDQVDCPALNVFVPAADDCYAYSDGWLLKYGTKFYYVELDSKIPLQLDINDPSDMYLRGSTIYTHAALPQDLSVFPNDRINDSINDTYTYSATHGTPRSALDGNTTNSYGWRIDLSSLEETDLPLVMSLSSTEGPVTATHVRLTDGVWASSWMPSAFGIYGKNGDEDWTLLYSTMGSNGDRTEDCVFQDGPFTGTDFELRFYYYVPVFKHVNLVQVELMYSNEYLKHRYLPDLTKGTYNDIVITGPESLSAASIESITSVAPLEESYRASIADGPAVIEVDLGRLIHVSELGIVFNRVDGASVNDAGFEYLNESGEWVSAPALVQYNNGGVSTYSGDGYYYKSRVNSTSTYASKVRFTVNSVTTGTEFAIAHLIIYSTYDRYGLVTAKRKAYTVPELVAYTEGEGPEPTAGYYKHSGSNIGDRETIVTDDYVVTSSHPIGSTSHRLYQFFNGNTTTSLYVNSVDYSSGEVYTLDVESKNGSIYFNEMVLDRAASTSTSYQITSASILSSNDGETWTEEVRLDDIPINTSQITLVPDKGFVYAKYVRFQINDVNGGNLAYINNLSVNVTVPLGIAELGYEELVTELTPTETTLLVKPGIYTDLGMEFTEDGNVYTDGGYIDYTNGNTVNVDYTGGQFRKYLLPCGMFHILNNWTDVRLSTKDGLIKFGDVRRLPIDTAIKSSSYHYAITGAYRSKGGQHWLTAFSALASYKMYCYDEHDDDITVYDNVVFDYGGSAINSYVPLDDGRVLALSNNDTVLEIPVEATQYQYAESVLSTPEVPLYEVTDRVSLGNIKNISSAGSASRGKVDDLFDDADNDVRYNYYMTGTITLDHSHKVKAVAIGSPSSLGYAPNTLTVDVLDKNGTWTEVLNETLNITEGGTHYLFELPEVMDTEIVKFSVRRNVGGYVELKSFHILTEDTLDVKSPYLRRYTSIDAVAHTKIAKDVWYNTHVSKFSTIDVNESQSPENVLGPYDDGTSRAISSVNGDLGLILEYDTPKVAVGFINWNSAAGGVSGVGIAGSNDGETWTDIVQLTVDSTVQDEGDRQDFDNSAAYTQYKLTFSNGGTSTTVYRMGLIMSDEVFDGKELYYVNSYPAHRYNNMRIPLPDGKLALLYSSGTSLLIIDKEGNFYEYPYRLKNDPALGSARCHYQAFNDSLVLINSAGTKLVLGPDGKFVKDNTGSIANTDAFVELPDYSLLNYRTNGGYRVLIDPITGIRETMSTTGLMSAANTPLGKYGPDGKVYIENIYYNDLYIAMDLGTLELSTGPTAPNVPPTNYGITLTAKGEMLFWNSRYYSNANYHRMGKIKFKGIDSISDEVLMSRYLR